MSTSTSYDWISVGGGAAGFFGAIQFAKRHPNASILILEATSKVLSKVKISGGGRCNVTHHCFDPHLLIKNYPRGAKELLSVFSRFQPKDTVAWFKEKGVSLKTESDGRMFPTTDDSQTIIDCFEAERTRLKIGLRSQTPLRKILKTEDGFRLDLENGKSLTGKRVLMATGSNLKAWKILEDLGHTITEPVPSLFSFNTHDLKLKDLSGRSFLDVRLSAQIGRKKIKTTGSLLITHWGLSGPAILRISSHFARELFESNYKFKLRINFLKDKNEEEVRRIYFLLKEEHSKKKLKNASPSFFPTHYWLNLLKLHHIDLEINWADLAKENLKLLVQETAQATFEITGKTTNKEEFVTSGGVNRREIDFRTMQSKIHPHLFLAGEVIDIDALTGGFNFQNAWSTSYIAATFSGRITTLE